MNYEKWVKEAEVVSTPENTEFEEAHSVDDAFEGENYRVVEVIGEERAFVESKQDPDGGLTGYVRAAIIDADQGDPGEAASAIANSISEPYRVVRVYDTNKFLIEREVDQ